MSMILYTIMFITLKDRIFFMHLYHKFKIWRNEKLQYDLLLFIIQKDLFFNMKLTKMEIFYLEVGLNLVLLNENFKWT